MTMNRLRLIKRIVYFLTLSIMLFSGHLWAYSVGPSTAPTATNVANWTDWTTSRLAAKDDQYATTNVTAATGTLSGFDFSGIPAGSTINGIVVHIQASESQALADGYLITYLSWDNGTSYTAGYRTPDSGELPILDTDYDEGGETDTWGHSWTVSEVTSTFKVKIWGYCANTGRTTNIDYVAVTVYYSIPLPTISSAANQTFTIGDPATAISTMTITDIPTPTITADNDIRIKIPSTFNMEWDISDTTATIGGGAASKVSTTVSYEDSNKTLVVDVTTDFAASDSITVSDLSFKNFSATSAADNLELETANNGSTAAYDDKTITIVGPTISSAANQTFAVGGPATAISTMTITDASTSPAITATNDIRIKIPSTFNMEWDISDTTATIGGGAAGKVSTDVSYEDSNKTLVIDVTTDFVAIDSITVSGLSFKNFSATSDADNLELETANDGSTIAEDDKTITVTSVVWTAYNDSGNYGNIATYGSPGNVTNIGGGASYPPNSGTLIKYSDGTDTPVTLAISGTSVTQGAGCDTSHGNPSYPPTGDAATEFGTIINTGMITYALTGGNIIATFTGVSNSKTYTLVVLGMRGESSYNRWSSYTISNVSSYTNSSSIGIPEADRTGDTTKYNAGYNWDNCYVAKWTNIVPTSDTITLTVIGIAYDSYPADKPYLSAIKLIEHGFVAAASISSAANQTFAVGDTATAISTMTITDHPTTPTITDANDIRIKIPSTFNMEWDISDTTATIGGGAAGKVSTDVSYEDSNKTLVIDVTTDFVAIDSITVSGLSFTNFSAGSAADNLELETANNGSTASYDDKTITIVGPTISSAANQTFAAGDPTTAISTMTITDASSPAITDANDIRIKIPSTFNMEWDISDTTATIGGGAAGKVSTDVSYEDSNKTLVIDVTTDFVAIDSITVSGLSFTNFSAASSADNLELEVDNAGTTIAYDDKTITITSGGWTAYNDLGGPVGPSFGNVTNYTSITGETSAGYLVDYADGSTLSAYLSVVGDLNSHSGQGAMSNEGTDAYDIFYGKIDAYGPLGYDTGNHVFTFTGLDPAKKYRFVHFGNRAEVTYTDRFSEIEISDVDSFNTDSSAGVTLSTTTTAGDTAEYCTGYNTANGYVAGWTDINPGSDGDMVITVRDGTHEYSNAIMLQELAAAGASISSAADQTFAVGDPATAISTMTITDTSTPAITAANDIRIKIPSTFNMEWDISDTTATIGGGAAGKVSTTVSYEDSNKTLVLNVTENFAASDSITVSGLSFTNFSAGSVADNLELETANNGSTASYDDKTITIVGPTISSAANQTFAVGDPATAISTMTITDASTSPAITDANDIRIKIPSDFNMTWDETDLTATIGGGAASKVSTTVSYEDSNKTLVIDVTENFAASDSITVSGLSFTNFSAGSVADNLELEVDNAGTTIAYDDKTIKIEAAITKSFQDGVYPTVSYNDTRDTYLDSLNTTTNYGAGTNLNFDGENPEAPVLIKWDISDIPSGSIVSSATITFVCAGDASDEYELYEMKLNWLEGNSTTGSGADWETYDGSTNWQTAGAQGANDRGSTILGTILLPNTPGQPYNINLNSDGIALVQAWINGTKPNYGIIIQDYVPINGGDVYSREYGTLSYRPKLTIEYTPSQTKVSAYTGGTPPVPPSYVNTQSTGNCLGTFRFDGSGTISKITITEYGTCDAVNDLENVKLFQDDGDGSWEPGYDTTQLGSTTTFSGASSTATFSGLTLTASATCYVHVVLDVKDTATIADTIGIKISSSTDVTSTKTATASSWPVQLGTAYIGQVIIVSSYTLGSPSVPPETVYKDSAGNCMGTFRFDGSGTITEITITQYGTCDAINDLENVKLFQDDGDGNWKPGDDTTQLDSTTTFNASNKATFSSLSLTASATCYVHVVLDVNANPTDDETVGIELYQDDIVCTTTTTASGWPVQLGTSNIAIYTGEATVAFICDGRPRLFGDGESQLTNDLNQINDQMGSGWTLNAVVTAGDMDYISESGQQTFDDAYTVSDVSTTPVFYAVGNHEIDNSYDMPVLKNKFSGYSFNPNSGPTNCEQTTYSYDIGEIHIVVINEYFNGTSDTGTDGDVVNALFDWLKNDLRNTTKPYKVVVGHEPAYPEAWQRHVGDSLDGHPDNRDRFWNLLKTERALAYFCGHTHVHKFQDYDGVFECDTGVSGGMVGESDYDDFATIFYAHFDETNGFQLRAVNEDPSWASPTVVTKTRSDLETQVMVNTAERAGTRCSYFIDYTAADEENPTGWPNDEQWWITAFSTVTAGGWNSGELCVGYDTTLAWPWMNTSIDNKNGVHGVFIRVPFTCYDKSLYNESMKLQVDYDEAVTVWLNGTEIYKSANSPTVGANDIWDKTASAAHDADGDADKNPDYTYGTIDVTSYMSNLNDGSNLLAIGNWNDITASTEIAAGVKLYLTRTDTMTVVSAYDNGTPAVPPTTVDKGTTTCLGTFKFGGAGTISQITITEYGTCIATSALKNVKLFKDDGDGNWESGEDTQIGSTTNFSGTSSTATFSELTLTASATCYVHVVLEVSTTATQGNIVGIEISQASDVTSSAGVIAASWPVQLGESSIGEFTIVSKYTEGDPTVPPTSVNKGSAGNCMGTFKFYGSTGTITQITITEYGSCYAVNDLENVKLFEDDGDGNWESGYDTQLGSTKTFSGTSSTATFSGLNLKVSATCYVHVVLDVKSSATEDETVGIRLYQDDIICTSTTTASSWPVQLGVSNITSPGGVGEAWTAYNDCGDYSNSAWDSDDPITNYGGADSPGELKTYPDGELTGVTITFSGTSPSEGTGAEDIYGPAPVYPVNGDAAAEFGTAVVSSMNVAGITYDGALDAPQDMIIELTGVSNSKKYTVVVLGLRARSDYTRVGKYIISDVTSFVNDSSEGVGVNITTTDMANDSTDYNAGDNWDNGYVAKWINIVPESSTITVTITSLSNDKTYLSAIKLIEEESNTVVSKHTDGTPPVPPSTVEIGDTGDCMGTFKFNGIGTISQIKITEYGSCDADGELENVKLYKDDGDGNWESDKDTQIGLENFDASDNATFLGLSLSAGSTCYVHVVLDVKSDATTGNTVGIEIYQASDVNSTMDVTATSWPVQLGTSTIKVQDTIAPSAVTNLSALTGDYYAGQIDLSWTAPGDDGDTGNNVYGSYYTLKFATYSVSDLAGDTTAWWNSAYAYQQSWEVDDQGNTEDKTLLGFTPGATYWFAIKTTDDRNNTSFIDTLAEGSQAWARAYEVHSSTGKYDFSESTGVTRWAWKYLLDNNIAFNVNTKEQAYTTKTDFTETMYATIEAPEETSYEIFNDKFPVKYTYTFQISEYKDYVSSLHGWIKVQSEIDDTSNYNLYIWNETNTQWEQLDTSNVNDAWEVLNGTISATCSDYIDSENKVSLAFYKEDPGNQPKYIWTDYVYLEVSILPPTDTEAPNAITNLSALTGDNEKQIELTWTAPGDDGTTGNNTIGAYYTVKYATYAVSGSTENWWNGDQGVIKTYSQTWTVQNQGVTEEHTLTMDEAEKEYWIAIKTTDEYGNPSGIHETSPVSAVSKAVSTQPPGSPEIYAVYLSSITMIWTKEGEPDSFIMQASTKDTCVPVYKSSSTTNTNISTLTVTGLDPNTTYYLRVGSLYSGTTEWISTPYPSTSTLADQVTNAQIYKVFESSVTLTWDALPQNPSTSTCEGYIVQASTKSNFDPIYESSSTTNVNISTLTVVELDAGTTYWFRVGSLNWLNVANYVIVGSTKTSGGIQPGDRYWVASSAGNWNDSDNWSTSSGGDPPATVPSSVNKAIFDGDGLGSCNIDIDASVTDVVIYSTYTATVSINTSQSLTTSSSFSIAGGTFTTNGELLEVGSYTQTGGIFNAGGSTVTCNGDFSVTVGTFNAGSSTVIMDATSGTWDLITEGTCAFNNLQIDAAGATIELEDDLDVDGNLTISAGTLDTKSGENNPINVAGNWAFEEGVFECNSSTVTFDNASSTSTLTGSTTFYGLVSTASGKLVKFSSDTVTYVTGYLNFEDITLRSTLNGATWYLNLNPSATQDVSGVNVRDSNASEGQKIIAFTSTDSGNNTNWDFGPPEAITDLTGFCVSATGDVTLSWSTPGDDYNWQNTLVSTSGYRIDYSTDSTKQWDKKDYEVWIPTHSVAPHTEVSYTITGLTGDSTWYFVIWTRDEVPTNWSGLSNGTTIWVNPILSVSISTDTYNFGELNASTSAVSSANITVTNDGNVTETYSIKCSSSTKWTPNNTPGNDEFSLQAAFHPSEPDNDDIDWESDDILTESLQQCTTAAFSVDNSQNENGKNVPPFESNIKHFWLRIKTPLSTSTTTQQAIKVTISAEQGLP
ncbi:hypothetical protein ES705_03632 [subsurface metagenome]